MKKTFMNAYIQAPHNYPKAVEITDEEMAVKECLARGGKFFITRTFEEASNSSYNILDESSRRYVGIDKVMTMAEVADEMERELAALIDRGYLKPHLEGTINAYRLITKLLEDHNVPNPVRYIRLEQGEYRALKDNEKVYDGNGQKIWPALQNATAPKPKVPAP